MFWFLASKYKSLEDFNLLIIIAYHQIFSIIWSIWNITPQWRTLTISLHELASKFARTWACFFSYFHIASIYDLYQWVAFFLGFSTESYNCQLKILIKIYLNICKGYQNVTNGGSIFEHDQPTNCFSVFDHFVRLARKRLKYY